MEFYEALLLLLNNRIMWSTYTSKSKQQQKNLIVDRILICVSVVGTREGDLWPPPPLNPRPRILYIPICLSSQPPSPSPFLPVIPKKSLKGTYGKLLEKV